DRATRAFGPRVGRDDHGWDARSVGVVGAGFAVLELRGYVIWWDRGGRRHVVVVTAVLVVGVNQQGAAPRGRFQHRFDNLVRPDLSVVHVVGVLLGLRRREKQLFVDTEQAESVLDQT